MRKFFFAVTASILVISACKKESIKQYDCTGVSPTYTNAVQTILNTSCAISGCHNAATQAEGINLSSYTGAKNAASSDRFLGSIQHISGYKPMPQNGNQLPESSIKTLSCWVQNGVPE